MSSASALRPARLTTADLLPGVAISPPGPGLEGHPLAVGATAIAAAVLRSVVLVVIAALLVLVGLPAVFAAAGT